MDILKNMLWDVMPDIWPMVIIITVIVSSLRLGYLIKNQQRFCFYKEIYMLIFILYILCLFEVVTFQDVNYGDSNFIPFKEIFRYDIGSRLFIRNILGNILLFLPYGFFASSYLDLKKVRSALGLTFLVSVTIEIVQLYIGRTFDIDDVILNVLGGGLGFGLYAMMDFVRSKLPDFLLDDNVINLVVILLIIVIMLYSFNLNALNWFSYIVRWL